MDLSRGYLLGETGALSQEHLRLAQILYDFDPNLELTYIPEQDRTPEDKEPFALFHTHNGNRYLVMTIAPKDMNHTLIEKVFCAALDQNDVIGRLEAADAAQRAMDLSAEMERREERKEFMASVIKSPLHTYRHNGKVYQ